MTVQVPTSPSNSPSRNDGVTMPCPVCRTAFRRVGRRRYCSDACRQAAFRARQPGPSVAVLPPPRRPRRATTIYECPACGTRYLGEQRCPDCQHFCRRVGPGGPCPHCDEPVAVSDLVADAS